MATLLFCVSLYLHLHRVHFTPSYFFYYRQNAAKWQTAGIKFTHRPKISIFAPQWRLIAPIHGKFGMTRGHMGPLGHTKFHANQFTGVGTRPQNGKNFHFLLKSRSAGVNIFPISTVVRGFYTPNYPALVFYIWDDSLHRLRSYCWETVHWLITPNFSMHPVGKTMRWTEKWLAPFWWSRCALSPCKVWERLWLYNMCRL